MPSSGMLRRVALVRTDVSEELSTFIIRLTRIGEVGKMLAVTINRRTQRAIRHNIPEDGILHSRCSEHLKYYINNLLYVGVSSSISILFNFHK
jgi:hypothetical protein